MRSARFLFALLGGSGLALFSVHCNSQSNPPAEGNGNPIKPVGAADSGADAAGDAAGDGASTMEAGADAATDAGIDSGAADANDSGAADAGATDAAVDAPPIDAASLYVDGAVCSDAAFTDPAASCGGPGCATCAPGQACKYADDCSSHVCTAGVCVAPTCHDGVENGNETDVDCGGGSPCVACNNGDKCRIGTDCASFVCADETGSGLLICQAPSCSDGILNGQETDVDCGGTICNPCNLGQKCSALTDCTSKVCGTPTIAYTQSVCLCPAHMELAPQSSPTGGDYCIDSFEVTILDYHTFASGPTAPDSQPPFCQWNRSWAPNPDAPNDYLDPTQLQYNGGSPQQGVNWCDAYAYCAHQYPTKHLCGSTTLGSVPVAQANDPTVDRWFNVCSYNGSRPYPYSGTYEPSICNGSDNQGGPDGGLIGTWPDVDSNDIAVDVSCQYASVYQMSGNVAEWEDSCSSTLPDGGISPDAGASDTCLVRGGSYQSNSLQLECGSGQPRARTDNGIDLGFRCCFP